MRSIVTLDFKHNEFGHYNINTGTNAIVLTAIPFDYQLSGYRFNILGSNNSALTSDMLDINNGMIEYEIPTELYARAGTMAVKLLSNEGTSAEIVFHVKTALLDTDNYFCKYDADTSEFYIQKIIKTESGSGEAGEDGATFIPSVSDDGVISWTNDKELENPTPVNIKGANGNDGKSIESVTEEYYLSTSKTTQAGGSWQATQPTWVSGKYLWRRFKITLSDKTVNYTPPTVDTAWEAMVAVFG